MWVGDFVHGVFINDLCFSRVFPFYNAVLILTNNLDLSQSYEGAFDQNSQEVFPQYNIRSIGVTKVSESLTKTEK